MRARDGGDERVWMQVPRRCVYRGKINVFDALRTRGSCALLAGAYHWYRGRQISLQLILVQKPCQKSLKSTLDCSNTSLVTTAKREKGPRRKQTSHKSVNVLTTRENKKKKVHGCTKVLKQNDTCKVIN